MMANKALLTWNIRPGGEREHFQRIRAFVNKLADLGLDLADAWYTIYGDAPQILLGIVVPRDSKVALEEVLASQEWQAILEELKQYITDYNQRIVKVQGQFQF
jgi:hypothetical protein